MAPRPHRSVLARGALVLAALAPVAGAHAAGPWPTRDGDYIVREFRFQSGESLPELRIHYTTLGAPVRDAQGRVTNAVLVLHGTGGDGRQFLRPQFADELYGPGQPLDIRHFFVILPDGIGHGQSSRPSEALHAHFPAYDYDDMVAAQYALLTGGLKVEHLRLLMGTSMGCMHAFVWGEAHPGFMDALMPLACLPVPVAGRNRMWRRMLIEAIRQDPEWKGGEYSSEPRAALRTSADLLTLVGAAPLPLQAAAPTREAADSRTDEAVTALLASLDANNLLYAVSASRNYDPSAHLEDIVAPMTWINSADDFINPPELGIAEGEAKRLKHGRFILIPAGLQTHGHGTHTWAAIWKAQLVALLERSAPAAGR